MNIFEAKNGHSIVRIEIEGMKHAIVSAITNRDIETEQFVRESIEKFCQPENISRIIAKEVDSTLEGVISEEIRRYFSYGKGREIVAHAVKERMDMMAEIYGPKE